MNALTISLKGLKAWQILVLTMVLAVAAGGTYAAYAAVTSPRQSSLSATQQLVPVQIGDLVNKVSTNGSLVFPNKESLSFGSQGKVAEVSVTVGQSVQQGDILAKLDAASIATLETALIRARQNLQKAQEALETAKDPYSALAIAQAESKAASARLNASKAQTTYDTVKTGPTASDIAKAQDAATQAATGLESAEAELETTSLDWTAKVSDAQTARDTAHADYKDIYKTWLGITVTDTEADQTPDALIQKWGVDLDALFNTRGATLNQGYWADGAPADNSKTLWNEVTLWIWTNLNPSEVVGTCATAVNAQVRCVMKEMTDSWSAYQKSITTLKTTQANANKAVSAAQAALTRAQDTLTSAQTALTTALAGPDPLEVDAKAKDLAVAQASLKEAEESLEKMLKGGDALDIEAKQAELTAAQLALETATENTKNSTLTAPFAGLIGAVNVSAEDTVGPNAVAIQVVDPTVVEINGTVDEIDVLFVRTGMQAQVTMDALSGQTLTGTVASMSTTAATAQGVVTYPITITVEAPEGVQLREGLSATANIVLREEKEVLLVPQQALRGTFDQPTVLVSMNGKTAARNVTLGNADDFWVVVRSGLAEGEQVVMETSQVTRGTGIGSAGGLGGLGNVIRGGGGFPGAGGGFTGGGAAGAGGGGRGNQRP